MVDYDKIDAELDEEIRAMYAPEEEQEATEPEVQAEETPAEEAEESEETSEESEESAEEAAEGEEIAQEESEEEAEETSDPVVPESRYKDAVKAMNKAQRELAEKRKEEANRDQVIQSLTEQLQAMQAQLSDRQQATEPESKPSQEPLSDEDLKEAMELYPEVITPLMDRINRLEGRLSTMNQDVSASKMTMEDYRKRQVQEAYDNHWNQILDQHPDTQEIIQTQEYADWYQRQPNMIQKALAEGSAGDVIAALNLYRSEYPAQRPTQTPAKKESNRQDKLAAAKAASSPNVKTAAKGKAPAKRTFTNAEIANMSNEEYRKYEAEIDQALAKGEIL